MSEEQPAKKSENIEPEITIKKSTYSKLIKGIVAAIAIAAFLGGYSMGSFDLQDDEDLTRNDVIDIIDAYVADQRQGAPQPTQQPTQPAAPKIVKVSLDDDPVKGNPDAPITIVEFSDFQCPFCARFYEQTLPLIQQNYIDTGKIKFVYMDFPIDSIHPNARPAHIAAECADEQGKFWDYHDILFERVNEWQNLPNDALAAKFVDYSTELELDKTIFVSCLRSEAIAKEVQSDYIAGTQYGVSGTPAFFVGTEKDGFVLVSGAQPYGTFAQILDSLLE